MNDNYKVAIENFINDYDKLKIEEDWDWFIKEKNYLKYEKKFLNDLSQYLLDNFQKKIKANDLKAIVKLNVIYKDMLPEEIEYLTWDVVCRLLDIFDEDKRKFYIDVCFYKKINLKLLNYYLKKDVYEKFLYCFDNYVEDKDLTFDEYLKMIDKVIEIEERIF